MATGKTGWLFFVPSGSRGNFEVDERGGEVNDICIVFKIRPSCNSTTMTTVKILVIFEVSNSKEKCLKN